MIGGLKAGSIVLGNPTGGVLALGGAVLILLPLLGMTFRSPRPAREKWGLLGLKVLALGLLVFCLFDPRIARSYVKPGKNIVLLLADESASMGMRRTAEAAQSRGDWTKTILDAEQPWLKQFARDFDLRRYRFGSTLTRVESFHDLTFQAPASRFRKLLSEIQTRFRGQPLAAIVLFSDGNSTDGLPLELEKLGVPLFPVVDESLSELRDLGLEKISVSQTHFEDAPVTVQATVIFAGKRPDRVIVTLEPKDSPESVAPLSQTLNVPPRGDLIVRFQLKPTRPGTLFYRMRVRDAAVPDPFLPDSPSREATLANNQRWIAVNRQTQPARILYVGGRPNWDYKFLNRAIASDPQLHLIGLIRIAKKEAKFDFRGRVGESSNSLFRGFKSDSDEETEDYSQPVLVRLNLRDTAELSDGFPKDKSTLYRYDAVILDDVEASFFSHDQQSLLDRFVSERGGGVLMLGGLNSFRNGRWERTPLANALPVYLNRPATAPGKEFSWRLSREGLLEPWLRLRETEQEEQTRLRQMPPFSIVNPVTQPKPGARRLAHLVDVHGRQSPAIVTQQYGHGRAVALPVGDLWKWSMMWEGSAPEDAARSWRQMIRWLVGDALQRVEVSVQTPSPSSGMETVIRTRVRTPEFQPDDDQHVEVQVLQPDRSEVTLNAPPDLREAGLYESHYLSRVPGTYLARVNLSNNKGEQSVPCEIGWVSDPAAEEFQTTRVNRPLLEEISRRTGGEVVSANRLDQFVAAFPHRHLPVMEVQSLPLWQTPWMILGVLGLLGTEWGIRRWKGLP